MDTFVGIHLRHLIPRNLYTFCLAVLCFVIPLYQRGVLSLLIAVLFVITIVGIKRSRKIEWLNIVMSGLGIFTLIALSLLWTESVDVGIKSVETKLALVFLPLIIGLNSPLKQKDFRLLTLSFISGLVLAALIMLSKAFSISIDTGDYSHFYYTKLSGKFHTSYLSMYYLVGICILLFKEGELVGRKWAEIVFKITPILFLLMIALLSSKAGMLATVVVLLLKVFQSLKSDTRAASIVYTVSLMAVFISVVLAIPSSSQRISAVVGFTAVADKPISEDEILNTKRNSTETRIIVWKSALNIMMTHPMGVGVGDSKDALLDEYENRGEFYIRHKKYNCHNQFLETGVTSGWFGILFLTIMILFLLYRSQKTTDWLLFSITTVITINLLTESMFERQSGAVFIALILSILIFRELPLKKD